jgi:hypothetical protein
MQNPANALNINVLDNIVETIGLDNALISAGNETTYALGEKVGRIASSPKKSGFDPLIQQNINQFKSSFVGGFINGYFKKENGNLNWSVLFFPIAIILGLIFLIRKF